jgi:phosphate butyryltransferase
LQGTLVIIIKGKEYVLNEGDSIYFDSDLPHQLYSIQGSARVLAVIYNSESMLKYTQSNQMKNLILAAKHLGGKDISVICPDKTVMLAVNKGIEEGIVKQAYLVGDKELKSSSYLKYPAQYKILTVKTQGEEYFSACAGLGVELITQGKAQLIMKGRINTAVFVKAILNKKSGITTDRRLSLISIFELPRIKRLIFLTDPGINPALVIGDDYSNSIDIIKNAIDVARGLGVVNPKVALLDANEKPSDKIPSTIYEKELSLMDWGDAVVYGPLSYDLALYEGAVAKKGIKDNPVAGKADVLVVPYISGGNFLYKAWAMTLNADVATIVTGASVPIILTSRSDSDRTKFLTLCASSVYSQYLSEQDVG